MSGYVIGLTGGVASGKGEAARRFAALGVAVADADLAAREAVAMGSEGLAEVVAAFGHGVLLPGGALDRAAMRRIVFGDAQARRRLETIVHPRVRMLLRAQCEAAASPYAVADIPLLAEGGGRATHSWLDRILVIDVPETVQAARVMARDGVDADLARRMIAAQATRAERLGIADDVIVNDGPLQALDTHVAALHRRYLAFAALS